MSDINSGRYPFIVALAGGVGGGKLVRGLTSVLPPERVAIVVNTADDFNHLGLHISPDIVSVLYAMADLNDLERGWGLAKETWSFLSALDRLQEDTWFKLGDRDLATHVLRTRDLRAGHSLSTVTRMLAKRLGLEHAVIPMTDNSVQSIVDTDEGHLDFQDYFVRLQCRPRFNDVTFKGMENAAPSEDFRDALSRADTVIVTPSNPFVSIDPILALKDIRSALSRSGRPVIAVSPIIGGRSIKGPLAKMMAEKGVEPSALAVAQHYGGLVSGWVIDSADEALASSIEALGCRVKVCSTLMHDLRDKHRLAQETVAFAEDLSS